MCARHESFVELQKEIAGILQESEISFGDFHISLEYNYTFGPLIRMNGELAKFLCFDYTGKYKAIDELSRFKFLEGFSKDLRLMADTNGRFLLGSCDTLYSYPNGRIEQGDGVGACLGQSNQVLRWSIKGSKSDSKINDKIRM